MKKSILATISVFGTLLLNAQAPVFQWAKAFNGPSADANYGYSVAVDASGYVFTTGSFRGTVDFNPGAGTFNLTSGGGGSNSSVFISKLDALGNFVWAKNIGGTGDDRAYAIQLDATGNIYITGYFAQTADFDPGAATYNLTSGGGGAWQNVFILKLNPSGNFVWAKSMLGISQESSYAMKLDPSGNIYTTGDFSGTVDFDPGAGVSNLTSAGYNDIFISKLDSAGNYIWAKAMGGALDDIPYSITLDSSNNIYTTGTFKGFCDFNPSPFGAVLTSSDAGANNSGFISKLDSAGNFVWAKAIGGPGAFANAENSSIVLDPGGNIYTTGEFKGTVDFDPNASTYNITAGANNGDLYVSKLNSSGNFVWAKSMKGVFSAFAISHSIALDANRNVYTTGEFQDTVDFNPGAGVFNLISAGTFGGDAYISKLDSAGNFIWTGKMGSAGDEWGWSMVVDGANNIYTTGEYSGSGPVDFDPGAGVFNLNTAGLQNIFVQKLNPGVATSVFQKNSIKENISVYPNPSTGSFNVLISEPVKNGSIEIYNSTGALIYDQKIVDQQNTIELNKNGLYFVKVISEGKIIGIQKIMKQ